MSKLENYITVSEFAELAGVSVQAVHKAMREKRITGFKRVGPVYLINRAEVSLYKDKKRKKNLS